MYGAGVLGSMYAARLQEAGEDVTILARGQRLADIREHGVILEDEATGRRTVAPVSCVERVDPDDAYDLILVLVRKTQVASVLPALAANRATPSVLFMVNNASGPEEYVAAVGRERVLLGFPGAGGAREGHVVRCRVVPALIQPTTLGELDGQLTPRLSEIGAALRRAGFPVALCRDMDAWNKTHVAIVSPIANALYLAGGDNYRLAGDPETLALMLQGVREGFAVLRKLRIPPTPTRLGLLGWPGWILVPLCRWLFRSRFAELVMARHAQVARDEMKLLADEFAVLARRAGVPAPALTRLRAGLTPAAA